MDYTTLGRTGLRVSVMGLGCGGHSRLGLGTGQTEAEAERIVREALALGVNLIDTAESYGTEPVVGRALAGTPRDQVVISTKAGVDWQGGRCSAAGMVARVDGCLRRLQTDYVDVFHLHGVSPDEYDYARDELLPAVQGLQAQGKVRFAGITEAFASDPGHDTLVRAVRDDPWDVVMVGFSVVNQSARERVLALTQRERIGTLCMFAVRRALSRPAALRDLVSDLDGRGLLDGKLDADDPLGFVVAPGVADSIPQAAYRFCRWEPGLDVILSGTGSVEHLRQNAAAIDAAPLPDAVFERLRRLFGRVDCVSGN